MTTTAGIIALGPLMVTAVLFFIFAGLGLAFSPFAAAITWYLARRRGLSGGRYALIGTAYSIFLLVPWLRLVVGLLSQRTPGFVGPVFVLLYFAWLTGPIALWAQVQSGVVAPWIGSCVFVALILMWLGTVTMSLETAFRIDDPLPVTSFRYIVPFALAWVSVVVVLGAMLVTSAME